MEVLPGQMFFIFESLIIDNISAGIIQADVINPDKWDPRWWAGQLK